MTRSRHIIGGIILVALFSLVFVGLSRLLPASEAHIGDFKLGDRAPYIPGDELHHPYKIIPPSRFYVYIWQPGFLSAQCVYEECGSGGEIVATMRGWLWGTGFEREWFHLPTSVASIIIVADANSITVGIYPNARLSDLEKILKKHPDLADFGMLKGIRELGGLRVGAPLPFKPTHMFEGNASVPQQTPGFYVYVVHETINSERYCPYYECGAYIDAVYILGGAFDAFDHDNPDIIKKLGLSPNQVARGEITLVVVADADGTVLSIHPNKDMRDIITILAQHPDLADMKKLRPERAE